MTRQRAQPSAQDRAYGWLKEYVAALPGTQGRFLTEAEVCAETGLSRTPVREALLRLEAEQFIEIMPNKGAYIPPITERQVAHLMDARALVEDWCVRRSVELSQHIVPRLQNIIAEQKGLKDRPVDFINCDREFHRTIVAAAGNEVIANIYESLRDRQLRTGLTALAASAERTALVLTEHQTIVDAIATGKADVAARAVEKHLASTLGVLHRLNTAKSTPMLTGRTFT